MATFRKERMGEAIRKIVCEKVARHHSLLPQGMVTINRVDVTADYGVAKIFYSVFGCDLNEQEAQAVMKDHQPEFRYEISKKLNLRRTPRIEFCFDKNTAYAFKINSLLSQHDN
jgi:ribosome-binding factor A